MKYNKALDYVALSMNALRKGNAKVAAKLLAAAVKQDDCVQAIRILEANNADAAAQMVAARAKVTTEAKTRIQAAEDEAYDDEMDPLDEVDADLEEIEDEDGDIDDGSVEAADEDEDGDDEPADDAEELEAVLASMTRKTSRRAKRG